MSAAQNPDPRTEDTFAREEGATPPLPVAERLESALGGDLTRFLLSALAGTQGPARGEPR
jgi:hypothetical protein